ncbi:hypothetical protein ACS0TY_017757 [Phlomoides rotata]
MSSPHYTIQDSYFYGLEWPKFITLSFIDTLVVEKEFGNWQPNSNNGPACMVALTNLKEKFSANYQPGEVVGHLKSLCARFNLFEQMISTSGVYWDKEENYVYASTAQWTSWKEEYPMSKAYLVQGEPLYNELKYLFGIEDLMADDDNPIIIPDNDGEDEQVPDAVNPPPSPAEHENQAPVQVGNLVDENQHLMPLNQPHPVPVINISSDEDEDIPFDVDIIISDSDDYFPLSSLEESAGEVVDKEDDDDEVISPMVKAQFDTAMQVRSFNDVIPRFKYEPADGVCVNRGPNNPLSKGEVGGDSSSAENSPLNTRRLFGEGSGTKK